MAGVRLAHFKMVKLCRIRIAVLIWLIVKVKKTHLKMNISDK